MSKFGFDSGAPRINSIIYNSYFPILAKQVRLKSIVVEDNATKNSEFIGCYLFTIREINGAKLPSESYIETSCFNNNFGSFHIEIFAIEKDKQRKGIGRNSFRAALREFIHLSKNLAIPIRYVTLYSLPGTVEFYRKVGFSETGHHDTDGNVLMYYDCITEQELSLLESYFPAE